MKGRGWGVIALLVVTGWWWWWEVGLLVQHQIMESMQSSVFYCGVPAS